MTTLTADRTIDDFIARWSASAGAERANFQGFAYELCDLLGVDRPIPSVNDADLNPYAFERAVRFKGDDGSTSPGRIDLYKRGSFVLEAKQSLQKGGKKELKFKNQPDLFVPDAKPQGKRSADRAWDVLMMNAKQQAEDYARALPASDGWPPFIIVCDVGHCFEIYADFTGQGKNYAQFPDRSGYRIYLEDLRDEKIRERLRLIWEEPLKLDPTRQSAKVTRGIAARLAKVSKALEARPDKPNAEDVSHFLMRCLFTMFAEDVKLLPENCFRDWLERARNNTTMFKHELAQLWQAMDKGDYATIAQDKVKRFNGSFFKKATVFDLGREEIGELWEAAKSDWKEVDPAIFGTLLEQALDPKERAKLGAHYTPRAYVERLVVVTIMEPLRQEWASVQATAERYRYEADALEAQANERAAEALKSKDKGKLDRLAALRNEAKRTREQGVETLRTFHKKLCETRVLDPACGTGNFLYVAMEMMKRLEGEVLDALLDLGGQEALALEKQSVDPHQFLGIELNPRAAAIAELVIWLGYLQWYYRTQKGVPNEPILRDFKNIECRDSVLDWDGYPTPKIEMNECMRIETYPNARKPKWPDAEYIVGNPPFIGGKDVRAELGNAYAETLWAVHKDINDSADFVMYWWDRAAGLLTAKGTKLQRFGFVTTNSITQDLSGARIVSRHLKAKKPISLLMAIADHPWTKATDEYASVRIAMSVGIAGKHAGVLRQVIHESGLNTDEPKISMKEQFGTINSDLTIGTDVQDAHQLLANQGICSNGMKPLGGGFLVTESEAEALGYGQDKDLAQYIKPYRNGRDMIGNPRGLLAIDVWGLSSAELRQRFPRVYQHLLETVKPERDGAAARSSTRDAHEYAERWWTFCKPRQEMRAFLSELPRSIVTVQTSKHRIFQFLPNTLMPDQKLIVIGCSDSFALGVLTARIHCAWTARTCGWLGVGNDSVYVKLRSFDPFPFPECSDALKDKIRAIAEELDAHRKARQAEHPKLTLTQMYNVLEALRAGEPLDEDDERIKREGLVLILKELHDKLDALVFEAYGWPVTLSDEDIIARLVALNKERAAEEKTGKVRWLRPDYQIPRFGSEAEQAALKAARDDKRKAAQVALALDDDGGDEDAKPKFPTDDELAETTAVMSVLATTSAPLTIADISRHFSQGLKVEKRVAMSILALARLGHIASNDNGETFALRRAATVTS